MAPEVRELLCTLDVLGAPSLAAEKRSLDSDPGLIEKLKALHMTEEVVVLQEKSTGQLTQQGRKRVAVHRRTKSNELASPLAKSHDRVSRQSIVEMTVVKGSVSAELVVSASEDKERYVERWDSVLLYYIRSELAGAIPHSLRPYGRDVVVVGGGPCGMFAAIVAALRNNRVRVVEMRPCAVRRRNIGLFPQDILTLARLGAPIELFNNTLFWCEKAGVTLFDLELFLNATALKVGVTILRNAEAVLEPSTLRSGRLLAKRRSGSATVVGPGVDTEHMQLSSYGSQLTSLDDECYCNFDLLVVAEGSRRSMTTHLVGAENVAPLGEVVATQLQGYPKREYYMPEGEEAHIRQVVSKVDWEAFQQAAQRCLSPDTSEASDLPSIPATVSSFVANMPRNVFREDAPVPNLMATAPSDWIAIPLPHAATSIGNQDSDFGARNLYTIGAEQADTGATMEGAFGVSDSAIARIHFEGMWPTSFEGQDIWKLVGSRQPKDVLMALFKACDVEKYIDEEALDQYIKVECCWRNPAQKAALSFQGDARMLKERSDGRSAVFGSVPGSDPDDNYEYFIVGDSVMDPWFRWGVGVSDGFHTVRVFADHLASNEDARKSLLLKQLEARERRRAVQTAAYFFHFGSQLATDERIRRTMANLQTQ